MCDCFHLAFPNWHGAPGTGGGRRLRAPEPGADDSVCDEPSQHIEGERPRPQGSSPVEEFPEKYSDGDDVFHKGGKKGRKGGFGFRRSAPRMSKLEEAHSPEAGVIVKTTEDGDSEGLVVSGGGKEGIFIKTVVPESPASKSLSVREGDQILSATVYFDNVTYEDALQILEHAQAYKVKLCLKRQPDIADENEAANGEESTSPQMRQHGKTKRHSEARISWPKFPSLGRGRKSPFTRSHSSSEADEQRKLELSPTTSDTESPIKTQDALKSKKKHKIKLSGLRKKGRISASVDEETDTLTPGTVNGTGSPEGSPLQSPESTTRGSPQVFAIGDPEATEQDDQSLAVVETGQHKVELINLESTLKTTDITVALAAQGSLSPNKSPEGKKNKKKEKSELKMRILGKDKKKEDKKKEDKKKEQSSPKRLQTMGASIDKVEPTENVKSAIISSVVSQEGCQTTTDTSIQVINDKNAGVTLLRSVPEVDISMPKVDLSLDMSGVGLLRESPQMYAKGKTATQTAPAFKLPTVDMGDIAMEETIQRMDVHVEERTTKVKRFSMEGTEVKEESHERRISKTQLPKREDIVIPGMEAASSTITIVTGRGEETQSETLQLAIDVNSVKEAVSKLPGFKLPQVDASGMPIPEEIMMIDANAQRISVKTHMTPTKFADGKAKQEAHFSTFDKKGTPDILTRTSVKLPKVTPADLSVHETITETKVGDVKIKYEATTTSTASAEISIAERDTAVIGETVLPSLKGSDKKSKKSKMPSFGITTPDIRFPDVGFELPKLSEPKDKIKDDSNKLVQEMKKSKTEPKLSKDSATLLSVEVPLVKSKSTDSGKHEMEATVVKQESKKEKIKSPTKHKLPSFKLPRFGKSHTQDISLAKTDADSVDTQKDAEKTSEVVVTAPEIQLSVTGKAPSFEGGVTEELVAEEDKKFKLPTFGVSVGFEMEKDGKAPESGSEVKEDDVDGQGSKFKLPKFGISLPKVKGPEINFGLSRKDVDVTLPDVKADIRLPEVGSATPHATADVPYMDEDLHIDRAKRIDITIPNVELEGPSVDVKSTGVEVEGKGPKFEMPSFGISIPKVKGPEINWNLSKKDVDMKAEVQLPEVEVKEPSAKVEIKAPGIEVELKDVDGVELEGKGSKFKMPNLGISMPKVKGPDIDFSLSKKDLDVKLPDAKAEIKLPDVEAPELSADISVPDAATIEVEAKMKKPGWSMPRFSFSKTVKAPEVDASLPHVDVSIPEGKVEVEESDVDIKVPEIEVPKKDADGSPTKFKMPTFKLPKFGIASSKATVDVPDVDIKIDGAELKTPKEGATVDIITPTIDIEGPSIDVKGTGAELEGKGGKFKMPSLGLSMPKIKGPEIDLSTSKKHVVDVTLPEVKAEVKLPDVELKEHSAEVEIKAPKIDVGMKDVELKGAPAKFKMPSFKLPKLVAATPNVSVEGPDVDMDIHIDGAEIKIPKEGAAVDITVPSLDIDIEGPSIDVKSAGVELEGKGGKFKMPSLGLSMPKLKGPEIDLHLSKKDVDVTLPEAKAEVQLPDVEVPETSATISVPDAPAMEVDAKMKKQSWSLPKFSFSKPSVKAPEVDVNLPNVDVSLPEVKVEVKETELEIKPPEIEVELDGQGNKFKMPGFGISLPKVKGPDIDLSLSKKDVDVTLPEAKAEVKLPDVEAPELSATISVPDAPAMEVDAKMKKQSWSLPKFSFSKPSVKVPEVDANLPNVDVSLPEVKVEVKKPELEVKAPEIEVELKDTEGSPSKFKMPTFKLPKFGVATPNVTVEIPDVDKDINIKGPEMKIPKATVDITAPSIDIEGPSIDVKGTGAELEGKGGTFKMPSLGLSMPKVKGPEIDLSASKMDVDVTLPEVKAEVKLPDVEVKEPSAEGPAVEMKRSRFSLPKFSFSKSSVKEPEVDVNMPGVDVSLPEVKVEVKEPELEIKSPEIEGELDGHGSKFKMPSFGISMPKIKGPEIDFSVSKKDIDVTLPEAKAEVKLPDVEVPEVSAAISVPEAPSVEVDAKMKKPGWSMPSFSFAKPSVKGPEVDVNLPQVDVSIPEGKVEVKEPEVEIKAPEVEVELKDTEGSPSKFKMPTFKLPKFGAATPNVSVEVPDVDIKGPEMQIPKDRATVDITAPSIAIKGPSIDVDVKGAAPELEGKGSKFKMPTFGISMPKVKGPEIDLSISKKDVDVKLPEAKAEVKLPDVKVKTSADISGPEASAIEVDAKMKKPGWSMPSFSFSKQSLKSPDADLPDVDVSLPEVKVKVKKPDLEIKSPEIEGELDGHGSKFKMPSFGISLPKVKGPEIKPPEIEVELKDTEGSPSKFKMPSFGISLPKVKGPEIKPPEVEVELKDTEGSPSKFKMPSFGISLPKVKGAEIKSPEVEVELKDTEGSPSKFKMPAFKLPKFGATTPSVTSDVDKDINIKGPEIDLNLSKKDRAVTLPKAKAEVKLPDVKGKKPSVAVSVPEAPSVEVDAKMKKQSWSMPSFSFAKPGVKGPEVDVNLPQVDVSIPEEKVEVKEPTVEVKAPEVEVELKDTEGSPSKFKMPTFKLPKFGAGTVSVEVPDVDKDINIKGPEMKIPKATVDITAPSIDIEGPGAELKGKGGKFKMPSLGLSMSKVKGPEIDLSAPKKDVDVTIPEVKAEVKLPDVEVKEPSADGPAVEMKRSRFSLPTFSFSKSSVKEPEVDVNMSGVDVSLPEVKVEVKGPELDIKAPETDIELDGQGRKFKMPSFGISMQKIKGPEIDLHLSKKDIDVTLPEAKAEVKLPAVEVPETSATISVPDTPALEVEAKMKKPGFSMPRFSFAKPSVKSPEVDVNLPQVDVSIPEEKVEVKEPTVEVKAPEVEVELKDTEGSPSKFKMPTFKLPKFGAGTVSVEVPDVDKDINIKGPEMKIPKATVDITAPSIDIEGPGAELKGKGGKFKMPSLGLSMSKVKGPEIDLSASKKDVDVTIPEVKAEVKLPDVEVKEPSAEGPAVEMKKSRFSLPMFSFSKSSVKEPEVDVNMSGVDVSLPEVKVEVKGPELDIKAPETDIELDGQGRKFKMPSFGISMQKIKGPEIDLHLSKKDVDVTLPEAKAEVKLPDVEVPEASATISVPDTPAMEVDAKMKKQSWSMPKFSFAKPSVKGPDVDVTLPDVDVSLPEVKVEVKEPELEIKVPEMEVELKDTAGSPSKFKMPTFKLPKFGATTPSATVEVPDVDMDINIKGPEIDLNLSKKDINVTLPEAKAEVKLPDVKVPETSATISVPDTPAMEVDAKMKKQSWSMPKFSFAKPSVKGPDVDVTLPDVDVSLPEVKVEVKEPELEIKAPEMEVELKDSTAGSPSKFKMPTFKLPKFGVATPSATEGIPELEADINIKAPKIKTPEKRAIVDITVPSLDIKGPSIDVKSTEVELEGKGDGYILTNIGLSMPKVEGPEISLSKKDGDVTLPEAKAEIKESEVEATMKKTRFSLPRFSFSKSSVKEPEADVNLPEVDVSLPEVKVEVKQPEVVKVEVKQPIVEVKTPESEVEPKNVAVSPSRFKMPTFKLPTFGVTTANITVDVPYVDEDVHSDEDSAIDIKAPSVDIDVDVPNTDRLKQETIAIDSEMAKTEAGSPSHGSPSKFKMPFKMPRLSFSNPKPEDEHVQIPADIEFEDDHLEIQLEPQGPGKLPKMTLTSFGEILKAIDVEFDVSTKVEEEEKLTPSKEEAAVPEPNEFTAQSIAESQTQTGQKEDEVVEIKSKPRFKFPRLSFSRSPEEREALAITRTTETTGIEKETNLKQESSKSPERVGWLKFPKFGLTSPSEQVEKEEQESEQSPAGDDDVSTTYSFQSSDAFADISSTVTSEQLGFSSFSPTKMTVKYSDPNANVGLGEVHGSVVTSTTRTELISTEAGLPEKVTILSSRDSSSSSVDTLKLESGKIHVITSNIQATPGAQQATRLVDFHVESSGGLSLTPEFKDGASWSVEESRRTESGKRTVVQKHVVRETSGESRETVVVTKKVTRVIGVESSGPVLGETAASSIRRLKDSVHYDKIKFFEDAQK